MPRRRRDDRRDQLDAFRFPTRDRQHSDRIETEDAGNDVEGEALRFDSANLLDDLVESGLGPAGGRADVSNPHGISDTQWRGQQINDRTVTC
jgi:hypothetical protein